MKCSIIMNVYNEENNLEYALKSLKHVKECDEILIADMGSTDKTLEIAQKYNATIIKIPYDRYFDKGRYPLIQNAKNEWCFLLDADEMISKTLGEKIDEIVRKNEYDAIYIPTINYYFGQKSKYGVHYPCHHCRLFKKQAVTVTGEMHNYLPVNNGCRELFINGEENALIHFPFNTLEDWMKKRYRYIKIDTENCKKSKPLLFVAIKDFCKSYFKEKNYKGGYEGFILAVLASISGQIANIKTYYDNKNVDIDEIKNKYLE